VVLNEVVELSPFDPAWPKIAERERQRIATGLDISLDSVEHIGSTAIRDLVAKPIIDLMLGVDCFPPSDRFIEACGTLGYESLGEAGVLGRIYLRRRELESCNLHIVLLGGEHWQANLAFRELLKNDSVAREQYAKAKTDAVRRGRTTLLEYSDAKTAIIGELLSKGPAA